MLIPLSLSCAQPYDPRVSGTRNVTVPGLLLTLLFDSKFLLWKVRQNILQERTWWGGNNQRAMKKVSEVRKCDTLLPKECRTDSTDQGSEPRTHDASVSHPRLGTGINLELSVTVQLQAQLLSKGRNPRHKSLATPPANAQALWRPV